MGEYINPLDLKKIYLDYFLGSPELLVFALLILVSYASAYFQLTNKNFGFVLIIASLLFTLYLGIAYYFFIIVIIGFLVHKGFARFIA
ncbi:MAG: hypothetical protein R6U59_08175 [Eubacteriales bacterium]